MYLQVYMHCACARASTDYCMIVCTLNGCSKLTSTEFLILCNIGEASRT